MPKKAPTEVTRLLKELSRGDESALGKLVPLVHREMTRLARGYLSRERAGHTLQPTALVNEAYLSLMGQKKIQWEGRAHFLAVAALAMRQVLIAHARKRKATKRGGGLAPVTLEEGLVSGDIAGDEELLRLDEALTRLAKESERQARIVELRYFGGLSVEETAQVLSISSRTVKREWAIARAWLFSQLRD